jgi:hypothetical protein
MKNDRLLTAAVYRVIEPDDQAVARVYATACPAAWAAVAPLLSLLAPLPGLSVERQVCLVATRRRLICYRLSRPRKRPAKILFNVPLAEVRINVVRAKDSDTIWYGGKAGGPEWRLVAPAVRRDDLYKVLALSHDGGAVIAPARQQQWWWT